ncbi:MAG: hypothetical protein ABH816_02580 [Candidatus Levyibacteriota bacterium]
MQRREKIKYFSILLLIVFFAGYITDIFFIKPVLSYTDWPSDIRLFALLFLWLFIGKISNFKGMATFKLTLIFVVILSFLFIFFRTHFSTERLASWVFVYLATGVIQQLFETRKKTV